MEPRKKQAKPPTSVPKEFLNTVSQLFNEQFEKIRGEALFTTLVDLYMDEAMLCISLTKPGSVRAVSSYLSMDLPKNIAENPEKVTEKLKLMVDIAASWFHDNFQAGPGFAALIDTVTEHELKWHELLWEGETVFVKLNHDNHILEKAADQFLQEKTEQEKKNKLH